MQTTYVQKNDNAVRSNGNRASSIEDHSAQAFSLQRKYDLVNAAAQRAEAATPRMNNTGLPDNLKNGVESLSGYSLDDVRVHYNSDKPATVQALAYTQGTDIHVAPGQEHALPHEAWHVAQQMAGRVSPTTNINGMPVNDNDSLEHEADVMGEKAVTQRKADATNSSHVVQKMTWTPAGHDLFLKNFDLTDRFEEDKEKTDAFGKKYKDSRLIAFNIKLDGLNNLPYLKRFFDLGKMQIHFHIVRNLDDCTIDIKKEKMHRFYEFGNPRQPLKGCYFLFFKYSELNKLEELPDLHVLCPKAKALIENEHNKFIAEIEDDSIEQDLYGL